MREGAEETGKSEGSAGMAEIRSAAPRCHDLLRKEAHFPIVVHRETHWRTFKRGKGEWDDLNNRALPRVSPSRTGPTFRGPGTRRRPKSSRDGLRRQFEKRSSEKHEHYRTFSLARWPQGRLRSGESPRTREPKYNGWHNPNRKIRRFKHNANRSSKTSHTRTKSPGCS